MKNHLYLLACGLALTTITSCSEAAKQEEPAGNDTTAMAAETPAAEDTLKVHGTIEFKSGDGLPITADSYEVLPGEKYILLCHQADYSRGEFVETAQRLNTLGYNCLAVDLRCGGACNTLTNETAKRAREKNMNPGFNDAEQDIVAAIDYIHRRSGKSVILVGSSYSASLALKIATQNNKVEAVAAFSPGEYLEGVNLEQEVKNLKVPVFLTSSKKESKDLAKLAGSITSLVKEVFVPKSEGDHGSKVLWPGSASKDEYWTAFEHFLGTLPSNKTAI